MKLITVHYLGFTAMDRRFSNPMLPWIVSEIRKRECYNRVSLGIEDGILQGYNSDFELQFSHKVYNMSRFSQADIDPCTFLYLLRDDVDQLLYCYLFQALKTADEYSDYVSEINNKPKKPQVLHVIDEVLDPVSKRAAHSIYNPTAFDFLSYSQFWDLGHHKVELFYRRVIGNRKENLFKSEGNYTFFVPVNEGFTDYRLQMFDRNVIDGHVIPNRVLFTRPSSKDIPFETVANGDYLYVVILLSGTEGKLYAKSHTLVGDSNHPVGEIVAEIVKCNIPVKNGVVHLIKRPLVVFDRRLTLFPYLPVMDKVSMDPTLDFSYTLGEKTGFNALFNNERKKFTFFIPRDKAWRNLESFLEINNTFFNNFVEKYGKAILSRHLVVSNVSYTIEDLRKKSNVSDTADVDLMTLGGILKIGIGETDTNYVIYWRNKIVPVYRANYQCTNGIVHVVDEVFMNEEDLHARDSEDPDQTNHLHLLNMLIRITV